MNTRDYLPQPYNRENMDMLYKTFGYPALSSREHDANYQASLKRIAKLRKDWGIDAN